MLSNPNNKLTMVFLNTLIFLLNPFGANAQTPISDGVSIRVNANVVDAESISLDIITLQHMTIRPEYFLMGQNEIYVSPIKSDNAGLMLLKGKPNTGVNIHYPPEAFIYGKNGDDCIKISYVMSGYPVRNQQASTLTEAPDVFIELNDDGEYFLWIGGLVDLGNAGAGNYSGDFIFEISYL